MEILEHISAVHFHLGESYDSAVALMAADLSDFFTEEAVEALLEDPILTEIANKAGLAKLYHGVPDHLARLGHDAHAASTTAQKHHARPVPKKKKVDAEDDAESSHMYAAMKMDVNGHRKAANVHYALADTHARRREKLGEARVALATTFFESEMSALLAEWDAYDKAAESDLPDSSKALFTRSASVMQSKLPAKDHKRLAARHREQASNAGNKHLRDKHARAADAHDRFAKWSKAEEGVSDAFKAASAAQTHAHMAQWRAGQLKKKIASKPSPSNKLSYASVVKKPTSEDTTSANVKGTLKPVGAATTSNLSKLGKKAAKAVKEWNQIPGKRVNKPNPSMCPCPGEKNQAHPATHDPDFDYSQPKPKMCPCPPKAQTNHKSATHDPEESTVFGGFDLSEATYSDEVKNASMLAAKASATAKNPAATPEQHSTAAHLHFIAHGMAKAHGHTELGDKHLMMHKHHKSAAKSAEVA